MAVKAKVDEAAVCCPNANCLPYNVENAVSFRAKPLFSSHLAGSTGDTEALGAWGYQDSYFVLNVKSDGSKYAMMKGTRYSISGKPLAGLVNFVEEELNRRIAIN